VTPAELAMLRRSCDKLLAIKRTDGEIVLADIVFVSDATSEILFEVVSSTHGARYADSWLGYWFCSIPFDDVVGICEPPVTMAGTAFN
jgi:hypothetical protein